MKGNPIAGHDDLRRDIEACNYYIDMRLFPDVFAVKIANGKVGDISIDRFVRHLFKTEPACAMVELADNLRILIISNDFAAPETLDN